MPDASTDKMPTNKMPDTDELTHLRSLLLSPEQSEIGELRERLNNPDIRAAELSRVIAEAIVMRASKDQKLATALLPTIETILRDTVKKDPKFLADTIFPVIGPAIRKAISESLRSMMESLSSTLDYTFSWRGIQWRIESIRTGKPFAEIILLHTLIYRIEQIFLIHKETGLVLQHVALPSIDVKDAGMVSGMLTAIQDFVNDSFSGQEDTALEKLDLGELFVLTEQGPRTIVAAVIRGNPPHELKTQLQEIVENIEFEYNASLNNFKGDAAPFETTRPSLLYCLSQAQQTDRKANKTPALPKSTRKKEQKRENLILYLYIAGAVCLLILIMGFIISRM